MKKLMIAAAIVCAAALSQAATFDWGATKNPLCDGVGDATAYSAYLVDISAFRILDPETHKWTGSYSKYTTAADVAAALKAGTFDGKVIYTATSGDGLSVAGSSTKTVKINLSDKALTGYNNGDPVDYYSIIFNNADVSNADQYLAHNAEAVATGVSSAGYLGVTLGDQSQTGVAWQSIPEPTSGLLLLLGVAGLALRRRRA